MAATPSQMLSIGTPLPSFNLPDIRDPGAPRMVASSDLSGRPAVIAFICNHCPYVKHIRSELAAFGRECQTLGVGMVAISSNDAVAYPADGPQAMTEEARTYGYVFPYLFDEDQSVAHQFRAACTPDFYLFDAAGTLAYRGQFDDSRPSNGKPVTGSDLRAARDAVLGGHPPVTEQRPSIGCNIKWKPGNEPDYYGVVPRK